MYQILLSVSMKALEFSKLALNLSVKDVISKEQLLQKKAERIRNQGLESGKR